MRTPALLLPPLLLAALLSLSLPAPAAAQEGLTPELAYKIEELSEQHIVEMDSEKIVVEVSGRDIPFRARPYRLRATFYEQNPEVLEIEELE